jgi:hypothetical protein
MTYGRNPHVALTWIVRVFRLRSCHLSRRTVAFRADERSCEPRRQHGVEPDRPLPQTTAREASFVPSWSLLHQPRTSPGVVVRGPGVCQGTVHAVEVGPAAVESSQHVGSREVVAALPDACRNPSKGQLRRRQAEVHDLDTISSSLPSPQSANVTQTAQCALEREISPACCESIEFTQQEPAITMQRTVQEVGVSTSGSGPPSSTVVAAPLALNHTRSASFGWPDRLIIIAHCNDGAGRM